MALSDTTVRQARITGNDYAIGDTDRLALNVTARGGKIWRFRYYWRVCRSACLSAVIRKSVSKKPVLDVTRRAPWSLRASTL